MEKTEKQKAGELKYPLIVEGRYDKAAIMGMLSGTVITTEGFGIFNSAEKKALILRLAERGKILLLTDSDGGGRQIRSYISGILPKDRIVQLYIPEIKGKERRKAHSSKSGLLGVEGVGKEVLLSVLSPYLVGTCERIRAEITLADLYSDGLTGRDGSLARRDALAAEVGLPSGMSAKALLSALNLLLGKEEYRKLISNLGLTDKKL